MKTTKKTIITLTTAMLISLIFTQQVQAGSSGGRSATNIVIAPIVKIDTGIINLGVTNRNFDRRIREENLRRATEQQRAIERRRTAQFNNLNRVQQNDIRRPLRR